MTYTCDMCNKTFKSIYHYNRHINRTNPCIKKIPCKICGKTFPNNSRLKRHLNGKIGCGNNSSTNSNNVNSNINSNNTIINNTVNIEKPVIMVDGVAIREFGNEDLSHLDAKFIKKCIRIYTFNKEDNSYPKAVRGYTHLLEKIYNDNENNRGTIIVKDMSRGIYEVNRGGKYVRMTIDGLSPVFKHYVLFCLTDPFKHIIKALPMYWDSDSDSDDEDSEKAQQEFEKKKIILEGMVMAKEFTDDKVKKTLKAVNHIFEKKNFSKIEQHHNSTVLKIV